MWSSRAISAACTGPAPPNATSAKSRGSEPRPTETARTASDISAIAIFTMPSAASATLSRSGSAIFVRIASRAASTSSGISPPRNLVGPRDAPAARADLDDVDDREHHGVAARRTADEISLRDVGFVVADEAYLRRRPAHVEGDDVRDPERATDLRRRDDPADRTGLHHRHRDALRRRGRHAAAVGLHDEEPAGETERAEQIFEILQILADARPDVGVEDRRRHTFILAIFAQDVMRERTVHLGCHLGQDLPDRRFVRRVRPRMDEAHGDGLDLGFLEALRDRDDTLAVQRLDDLALGIQPLRDLERQMARDVGFGPLEE